MLMIAETTRAAQRHRLLQIEQLEDRLLLAGNVTLGILVGGGPTADISLIGDADSNSIAISTEGGELTVEGLDGTRLTPGAFNIPLRVLAGLIVDTDFDGVSASFFTFNSSVVIALNDIQVSLGAGNDNVAVSNLSLDDNLSIDTGVGSDNVLLSNVYVDDSITLATGDGNDMVNILQTTSDDGAWSIATGSGNDSVSIAESLIDDDITIVAGTGNNQVTISNSAIAGRLDISAGSGSDEVLIEDNVFLSVSGASLGAGNDQFVATGNMGLEGSFNAGAGDDAMLFANNQFVGLLDSDIQMMLGTGNDELVTAGNTFGNGLDILVVDMGEGNDYYVSGGNIFETPGFGNFDVDADGGAGYDILVALDSQPSDQFDAPPMLTNWELIDPDFAA
ncbi:LEPR-XLL domain-containing protein [Maioricimonas sp. JC845]|uniref:LEPR-XLL domain-containing protein n=1 Tax=Maioricimonas sp. JC845 TaxID=3232138 RepID=UPI0034575772